MQISYTELCNITCPIRHYFYTMHPNKRTTGSILGIIVHTIYQHAVQQTSFAFADNAYITTLLHKIKAPYLINSVNFYKNVYSHLHNNIFKLTKNAIAEQVYTFSTNRLLFIPDITYVYNKPDIVQIHKDIRLLNF